MLQAAPDPGVLKIRKVNVQFEDSPARQVTWANLFAINDRQSVVNVAQQLIENASPDTVVVGLLNNRHDREDRARQFVDIVTRDLQFDYLATLGAYENLIFRRLQDSGMPHHRIVRLGDHRQQSLQEMLSELVCRMPATNVMLVGLVNIHTPQAEMLSQYFECDSRADSIPVLNGV